MSDIQNGTAAPVQNVSDASVGASALSRIRAIQSAAGGEGGSAASLGVLWNVCFWSAAVIGGFAVVHLALLALLAWRRKPTPKMLHAPRLELLLFMIVLPMICAAGATLLRADSAGYVAAGALFAVALPAAFLGTAVAFIIRHLLRHAVDARRAVYVLHLPPGAAAAAAAAAPATPTRDRLARDSGSLTQQFLTADSSPARLQHELLSSGESLQFALALEPSPSLQFVFCRQTSDIGPVPDPTSPGTPDPAPAAAPSPPAPATASTPASRSSALASAWAAFQLYCMRPLLGFTFAAGGSQQPSSAAIAVDVAGDGGGAPGQGAWLCKSKHDTAFVKRYGSLFEDARGPQVYHITSAYDAAADDDGEGGDAASAACASGAACVPLRLQGPPSLPAL